MHKFMNRRQGYEEAKQDEYGRESENQLVSLSTLNSQPATPIYSTHSGNFGNTGNATHSINSGYSTSSNNSGYITPTQNTEMSQSSSFLNQNDAKSDDVSIDFDPNRTGTSTPTIRTPTHTRTPTRKWSERQYYDELPDGDFDSQTPNSAPHFQDQDQDQDPANPNSNFNPNAYSTRLKQRFEKFQHSKYFGFTLLALSAFFFSVMSLFVSLVHGRIPSMQMVWWRCFVQFALALIGLRYKGVAIWGPSDKQTWLILRALAGVGSLSCFYFALTNLPLSDATVLFFTAPIFTGILGRVLLKESYDFIDFGGAVFSTVGIVFVSRPSFIFGSNADDGNSSYSASERDVGVILALVGAFFASLVYICIRKVGKGVDALVLVQYMGAIGIAITPFSTLFTQWHAPEGYDIIYTIMVGLAAFCAQCSFNAGVQIEKAGPASLIRNLDVVFAFIWQTTVEGLAPHVYSGIGAIIILTSVIGVGIRNWRRHAAPDPSPSVILSDAPAPLLEAENANTNRN